MVLSVILNLIRFDYQFIFYQKITSFVKLIFLAAYNQLTHTTSSFLNFDLASIF